ncbi:FecCD family ABC transporter permease [Streptomyces acidiscabies]|uniref:Iron ABC transporter permease n=1 Tax=Streptomyces acidiscabies TaxID=42234 RepID=A0AAP6B5K4_9ACTN|nr:iron ABC transporter permease [Streptomyces acidiscabies]MBP5941588.1 iron ABC transporter permease [Streptomyces sp. LBUM 1476]MBZ3912980.1 iron ABC transporter permease [Streptomyces acidiscabies]MDX2958465.1 iron ABC transporter permease [Streptomyces acidiscabies]MDX3021029.1 iron ABC transporter permease [Streptomyces acidiscabies]MDX3794968.1 iron ABC transporter permease [Streptomyces acidiscabies]
MSLFLLGTAALVLCTALSLALGARSVPLSTVADALFGDAHGRDALVVTGLRLPRTVIGLFVGAALGVAGAVAQGVTRNPLASPTTLGINAGAGFAVVVAIYALGLDNPVEYVWFAFAGAAAAALFAQALARRSGDIDPVRLALGGTVLQLVLISWTSAVMLLNQRTLDEARFWLAGSLAERPLSALWQVLPTLVLGLVVALAVSPALNTLALGDDSAAALGVPVGKVRLAGGIAVVLLAGSSVAVAGPVAFIGLAAPHLVRPFLGSDHRLLVPGCLLAGPILLLSADVLGRLVIRPSELEVGIVTAFLGAPLLALLARKVTR